MGSPKEKHHAVAAPRIDAHYRALFDALPVPVVITLATDSSVAYVNPACLRLVGATDPALVLTRSISDRLHPDDREKAARNVAAIVAGRDPHDDPRYRVCRDSGEYVDVDIYAIPTEFEGQPAMFSLLLDVSELAAAQSARAELSESNAALEEASRAKSTFLANMSHELRTPLNSIIGFTGIMLQGLAGDLSAEQRAQLEMVNRAGRQLLGLVSDILDMERIETRKVELDVEDVDVVKLVTSLAETVRPMAADVGLTLEVSTDGAPARVRTDRRKLEQILLNLLSNAVKYTDEGGVMLTVETRDHGLAAFAVRDTGVGIATDDQARVFEEFRQLPSHRGAKHPGSGLGLAISRQLAELLGGRIEVESAPGEGATFTLVLPVA